MRIGRAFILFAFTGVAVFLASQVCVVRANFSLTGHSPFTGSGAFAGHWEGKMNDLPGIDLKIEERGGKISGEAIFYYQERSDPSGPWQTKGEYPVPLLVPRAEGDVLTFEVEHHKCHDCKELDANAKFRLKLTGPNEARLWRLERGTPMDEGLKLVRRPDSKKE